VEVPENLVDSEPTVKRGGKKIAGVSIRWLWFRNT
jgi:hypothetical protein